MVALPQINQSMAELLENKGSPKLPLIPAGKYPAVVVATRFQPTKAGDGQYLEVKIFITQGDYKDREFIARFNLVNKSEMAKKIAYEELALLSAAVGLNKLPEESDLLHNRPFLLHLDVKMGDDWTNDKGEVVKGTNKNEIGGYSPMPTVGGFANTLPTPTFTAAPVPTEQPATPSAPPWAVK